MSYDEQDAAYDQFIDELYKDFRTSARDEFYIELYDEVVKDFKESRLKAFYLANPSVAELASAALTESKTLLPSHPSAALVFAITAGEVCLREALLNPVIYGLFHTESAAELIVKIVVKIKDEKLYKALTRALADHTGVDLHMHKRPGSLKNLWEEMVEVQKQRNSIVHQARLRVTREEAEQAIAISEALLQEIFPGAVKSLGLHLHEGLRVCGSHKCTGP